LDPKQMRVDTRRHIRGGQTNKQTDRHTDRQTNKQTKYLTILRCELLGPVGGDTLAPTPLPSRKVPLWAMPMGGVK